RAALRPEPGAELLEEPEVDVDILVGRAIERAHLGRRRAAPGLGLAAEEHRRYHRVAAKRLRPVGLDAVHVSDDPAVLRSLGIRSGTTLAGHGARAARLADLLAVEAVQLVEHIDRGAASAAAKRQDKSQNHPDDAQAAPAQRDCATAHAAP